MNDFTKEELQELLICCDSGIYDDHPLEDWKAALQVKIQFMIDNYCEHSTRSEAEVFVDVCFDCDAMILRNETLSEYNE